MELFHWNPSVPVVPGRIGKLLPLRRPVNNFGDLLGPLIVRGAVEHHGLNLESPRHQGRLLSVGSVMHFAQPGDVIWGTGVNGKISANYRLGAPISIRAVRGPLTRKILLKAGHDVPEVYGDPGLLISQYYATRVKAVPAARRAVSIVPNLNDLASFRHEEGVVPPTWNLWKVMAAIYRSDFVVASSLHAVIVADAFGIPNRLVSSRNEPRFKYEDYYQGTDRELPRIAETIKEALKLGPAPTMNWSSDRLVKAFPSDLWAPLDASLHSKSQEN